MRKVKLLRGREREREKRLPVAQPFEVALHLQAMAILRASEDLRSRAQKMANGIETLSVDPVRFDSRLRIPIELVDKLCNGSRAPL